MQPKNLVVISSSFALTFPSKIFGYIRECVQPGQQLHNYSILTCAANQAEVERRRYERAMALLGPVAIIGISVRPSPEIVAQCQARGIPIVLIDEQAHGCLSVYTDNTAGARLAAEYVADCGYRLPALIVGNMSTPGSFNAVQRYKAFEDILCSRGITLGSARVTQVTDYTYLEGVQAVDAWLDAGVKIDVVFSAAGDECAMGAMRALHKRGLDVPDDVAVIGYDNIDNAAYATPPLTTIHQPLREMAVAAYEMANNWFDLSTDQRQRVFEPSLIKRVSA